MALADPSADVSSAGLSQVVVRLTLKNCCRRRRWIIQHLIPVRSTHTYHSRFGAEFHTLFGAILS
jgi:hypothetical protein